MSRPSNIRRTLVWIAAGAVSNSATDTITTMPNLPTVAGMDYGWEK